MLESFSRTRPGLTLCAYGHRLADGPDLDAVEIALARDVVGVHLEVGRLQVREGLHLETHARVAGRHEAVADVLFR